MSEPQAGLEREAASVSGLLEQSKARALTLPEKLQLAGGLNALAQLIDGGHRAAPAQYRQSVEVARQRANRLAAADMFLNLPRNEALQRYPALAHHYAVVEAIDRHGDAQGQTSPQRAHELRQAQQRSRRRSSRERRCSSRLDGWKLSPDRQSPSLRSTASGARIGIWSAEHDLG